MQRSPSVVRRPGVEPGPLSGGDFKSDPPPPHVNNLALAHAEPLAEDGGSRQSEEASRLPIWLPVASRRCAKCGENRPLDEFAQRLQDGRRYPVSYCRGCKAAHERSRYQRPDVKARYLDRDRQSRVRFPDRVRARRAVQSAIAAGRLTPGVCYALSPECRGSIEAHHPDYSKPVEVVWSCKAHHRALDDARREVEAR